MLSEAARGHRLGVYYDPNVDQRAWNQQAAARKRRRVHHKGHPENAWASNSLPRQHPPSKTKSPKRKNKKARRLGASSTRAITISSDEEEDEEGGPTDGDDHPPTVVPLGPMPAVKEPASALAASASRIECKLAWMDDRLYDSDDDVVVEEKPWATPYPLFVRSGLGASKPLCQFTMKHFGECKIWGLGADPATLEPQPFVSLRRRTADDGEYQCTDAPASMVPQHLILLPRSSEDGLKLAATLESSTTLCPDIIEDPCAADVELEPWLPDQPPRISLDQKEKLQQAQQAQHTTRRRSDRPTDSVRANPDALFRWPFSIDARHAIVVLREDLKRLEPGEFLNDTLVDLFLQIMQLSPSDPAMPQELKPSGTRNPAFNVHFFSTQFYSKLTECPIRAHVEDPSDPRSGKAAHLRVARWTRSFDLFETSLAFVPVNEDLHWSCGFICHLDLLESHVARCLTGPSEHVPDNAGPVILFLDSLGAHDQTRILANLRVYLKYEYLKRAGQRSIDRPRVKQTLRAIEQIPFQRVRNVPRQKNLCDCGVYLLAFVMRVYHKLAFISESQDLGNQHVRSVDRLATAQHNA